MTVEIEIRGLEKLIGGLDGFPTALLEGNRKAMQASTLLVEAEAKARVARRTGRLASSISSEVIGGAADLVGRVYTDVAYARDVEYGTRPHEIVAHGQALMLPISPAAGGSGSIFGGARLSGSPRAGQQVAFFKRVHHPGTRAEPFMKPALEESIPRIEALFKAGVNEVLEVVAKA